MILSVYLLLKNFIGEETKLAWIFKLSLLIKDTEHSSFLFSYEYDMFYQTNINIRMGNIMLK